MKSTFAAAILALIIAGCKAGPASTTDPFFGNTRVAPPPTGSAQAIPPGSGYYQTPPGGVPSGTPVTPGGTTLPPPPGNSAQPGQYIPLNGGQPGSVPASGASSAPTTVYPPASPVTVPPASGPYGNPGPYRSPSNSSPQDPFPNSGASLSPVRGGADANARAASSPSIEQTTALGNRGSRVVVPEKALNWQETPRTEQSTFGAELEPAPRVGGSLTTSGSPLVTRPPTAAEASSRPLADRQRITSTVGAGGRLVENGARGNPPSSVRTSGSTAGSGAPGYLPQTEPSVDIMDLPPARNHTDSSVRPTSATAPLTQERAGAGGIYFQNPTGSSGTAPETDPRHPTTPRRLNRPERAVFRGTLNYSDTHRRWYVDLDPAPQADNAIEAKTILLADDLLLSGLKRGDYVELEGRVEEAGSASGELPVVKTLAILSFRSQ